MTDTVEGLRGSTADVELNTRMLLEHAARGHREQEVVTAYAGGDEVTTYAEMWENVQRMGYVLEEMGVEPGEVVGLYGYSTARYMEMLYAISSLGAAAFTINLELPDEHQRFCLEHVDENAPFEQILVAPELVDDLSEVVGDDYDFEYHLIRGEAGDTALGELDVVAELMADEEPSYDFPEVDEQSTAVLMFTSGTTGKPKAVAHTHRMVYLHTVGMVASKGVGPQDSQLMVPPMFHLGWLLWGLAPAAGSRLVLPGPGYPDNLANLLLEKDVTFTAGVATLFKRIVEIVEDRRADGEDITLDGIEIVFGGQSPPTPLLRDLEELGADTSQVYGYTEAGPQFCYNVQNHLRDRELAMDDDELFQYKADVAGYFVTGVRAKIIDPDTGEILPWDGESEGEIAYRAPWGTAGYWEMPEATEEATTEDGYLKMGDLVRIDEWGNVEVLDRIKDVIKSGGEWIPSPVLEDLIAEHPDISDAVTVAVDHEEWVERPLAVVVLEEGVDAADVDLSDHLMQYVDSGEIEKWWIPDELVEIGEIPKTSVGKYDKKTLRDQYQDVLASE